MKNDEKYAKTVKKNQDRFEKYLSKIEREASERKKIALAKVATKFAVTESTGYFRSSILENTYINYAKSHDIDNYDIPYVPNSFLHVMTRAYNTGGHTRVVERWITQSSPSQKHSIVILNQNGNPYPEKKLNNITNKKRGKLFLFDDKKTDLECALSLRKLGLEYEYIILHVSPQDPTALIAFGTDKFTRPIIYFNHADHLFWLGVSIADKVADLRTITSISKEKRGIVDSYMLGVPSESNGIRKSGIDVIQDRDVTKKRKIIVTSGAPHKYSVFCNKSLPNTLIKLTKLRDDISCIAIGPSINDKTWKTAYNKSKGKVNAIGYVNWDNGYLNYINQADVVIDSWPMGGGTALIDAITLHKPVLSLASPLGQFDYIIKSSAYCHTEDELITKTLCILDNPEYANKIVEEVHYNYFRDHNNNIWRQKLDLLISLTPKQHTVKLLDENKDYKKIDELSILNQCLYSRSNMMKIIDYILQQLELMFNISERQITHYFREQFPKIYNIIIMLTSHS